MKIFLDDLHDTERAGWVPEGFVGVKNFEEFKSLVEDTLNKGEKIENISFDNDLGQRPDGSNETEGWEIAKWLVNTHPEIFLDNPELRVHSQNNSASEGIEHWIAFGRNHFKKLIEAKTLPDPWSQIPLS